MNSFLSHQKREKIMPFQVGFKKLPSKAEIEAVEAKKKAEKAKFKAARTEKAAKKAVTSSRGRRSETEALLFGSELFEPIARKEKEIIITFRGEQTKQGLHISRCGRFAYERTASDFYYNLYYFLDPFSDYSEDIEVVPSDQSWLFDNLTCAELEECAIKLKRAEYADEKAKLLEEIKEQERLRKIENDKIDEEFEKEQEMAEQNLLDLIDNSIIETQKIEGTNIEVTTSTNIETNVTTVIDSKIIEVEAKPKSAFVPLVFKKVEKK
jgi:hypothetical protein